MEQSNVFLQAIPIIKEKLPECDCDYIIDFLSENYHSGDMVYPNTLSKISGIGVMAAWNIMEACVEAEVAERYIGIYCDHCKSFSELYYLSALDIPDTVVCWNCRQTIHNTHNHIIDVYKIL